MSPYEIKLLIEIGTQSNLSEYDRMGIFHNAICNLVKRRLIEVTPHPRRNWQATKLGYAVCNRFYSIDESSIKFCGKCGNVL